MRVIIVDDEYLARAVLREHLARHPDVEIVGECANGFEAVKAIAELRPDLIFLDIQMPKLDGFEVVELAGAGTHYLFVTAFDAFALRAFEVHALDYLLKPFSGERLAQAKLSQHLRNGFRTGAVVQPQHLAVGSRWIGERSQHIEYGPHPKLPSWSGRMLQRWMVQLGEHKADADLPKACRRGFRRQIQLDAKRLQYIRAAGFPRHGAIAVFGHLDAGGRRNNGRSR